MASPAQDSSLEVSTHSGNTAVTVTGMDLDPRDTLGWNFVGFSKPEEQRIAKPNKHVMRRMAKKIKTSARLRMPLPKEDIKVILRIRGGINLRRECPGDLANAAAQATGMPRGSVMADSFCVNGEQNILIIGTSSVDRAKAYGRITSLAINGKNHDVSAYAAAPHNSCKGVIKNINSKYTQEDLEEAIIGLRNPMARGVKRIGNSRAVAILFEGDKVPYTVCFWGFMVKCSLYRKTYDTCWNCGEVGHRADVCPTPTPTKCPSCGKLGREEHQCSPECKLCGGPHPTGDKTCRNRHKTPYIITKRKWEKQQLPDKEPAPEKNQINFPELDRPSRRSKRGSSTGRSRSRSTSGGRPGRSRSNSRSRSRSRGRVRDPSPGRNVTWAETASGKKSKSQPTETSELEYLRRTVKDKDRAIDRLLRKMDEDKRRHEETEKHLMKRIDDLMKGLKDMSLQQQDVTRTPNPSDQPSPTAEPAPVRRKIARFPVVDEDALLQKLQQRNDGQLQEQLNRQFALLTERINNQITAALQQLSQCRTN